MSEETTDLAPRPASEMGIGERPQYIGGFDGMATEPFAEATRRILAEPVPPEAVEIKPNGIVFVPGVYYRRQLTRAFGAGGWAIVPRGPARVMGDLVVYPGALFALGRFVSEAVGECVYRANSQMSYASCVEGAKTDALSRCCKDLGMATELWDAAWRNRWMDEYAEKGNDGKWRVRSGRPVQELDLMSGAGGVVKAVTPKPAPISDVRKEAAQAAPKAPAVDVSATPAQPTAPPVAGAPSSKVDAVAAAFPGSRVLDTGEPATDEQKKTLRDHAKRLDWKKHFGMMWLKGLFGFGEVDALSADQCLNACLLAEVFGTPKYKPLIDDMRADGLVRPEQAA